MELNMDLKQTQTLSHQQIQSMKILQMSHQELVEHIGTVILENPVLDAEEPFSRDENKLLIQKLKWLEAEDWQNQYYIRSDREEQSELNMNVSVPFMEESLLSHIEAQLDGMRLSKARYDIARYVAANLDQNGYLQISSSELAESLGVPVIHMEKAVRLIRTLDPAGIGAADLKDCLKLQLSRMENTELPIRIVRGYLEQVSKNQFGAIAKALHVPETEIRAAVELIRTLDPKPGMTFYSGENANYVRPDIIIVNFKDYFEILIGDYDFPSLHINAYYRKLLTTSEDMELRDYLGEKLRQAKWLINSIEQRRSTLMKCTGAILEAHEGFFRGMSKGLAPLTMADLAGRIGVHESTVSRAIRGKYLQCVQGVFPLRFFFSRMLGTQSTSVDWAKRVLRELIEMENKLKPLSDQKITEYMKERGIDISRRTVAKYRSELHIPNASGRRII